MATEKIKQATLSQLKDKYIGEVGSQQRDEYEFNLQLDVIGEMIKKARKEKKLTQEELGKLINVQKAQISRLEKNTNNISLETIIKVFKAMNVKIKLKMEIDDTEMVLA